MPLLSRGSSSSLSTAQPSRSRPKARPSGLGGITGVPVTGGTPTPKKGLPPATTLTPSQISPVQSIYGTPTPGLIPNVTTRPGFQFSQFPATAGPSSPPGTPQSPINATVPGGLLGSANPNAQLITDLVNLMFVPKNPMTALRNPFVRQPTLNPMLLAFANSLLGQNQGLLPTVPEGTDPRAFGADIFSQFRNFLGG